MPHQQYDIPGLSLYTPSGERKYLNTQERQRLLKILPAYPSDQALFIFTLIYTGFRVSEALALTPMNLLSDPPAIAVRSLKKRSRKRRIRSVPVPAYLMWELQKAYLPGGGGGERRDKRIWGFSRTTGWRMVKEVMAAAGIQGPQATARGLRHTFGTHAVKSGVPITLIQKWLGHEKLSTTAIYTQLVGPDEIAAAAKMWEGS